VLRLLIRGVSWDRMSRVRSPRSLYCLWGPPSVILNGLGKGGGVGLFYNRKITEESGLRTVLCFREVSISNLFLYSGYIYWSFARLFSVSPTKCRNMNYIIPQPFYSESLPAYYSPVILPSKFFVL
jgi:hypothetical protein